MNNLINSNVTLTKTKRFLSRIRLIRILVILLGTIICLCNTTSSIATTTPEKFSIQEATIASIQDAIKNHQITCTQLVQLYLERIKQYDLDLSRGAPINAFVSINPNVIQQAQQLDDYFTRTNKFSGMLFCVPMVIKDNMDSYDFPSTSGSLALLGSQPPHDAFIVKQLRDAGAIILGKGAMDEFASGMIGISSRSGRVGNAFDPNKNAGGSSGGVAAAVSANFALAGIGTDNSGSVRAPAVFNGDIGLRPSTDLISHIGIFPRGNLDGVAGPITRNATDLAKILTVIAAPDPNDARTLHHQSVNYVEYLNADGLRGKRIGVVTEVGKVKTFDITDAKTRAIFTAAINRMQNAGAIIIQNVELPKFDNNRDNNMAGEVQDINAYLAAFPSTRKNYRDICLSGRAPIFGTKQSCLQHLSKTANKNGATYQQVLVTFARNQHYVERIMDRDHLDALLLPINAYGAATEDITKVNTWRAPITSNSGLPGMAFVAGYTNDQVPMPVGMELVGRKYTEATLIGLTYSYERHFGARKIPELKTANDSKFMGLSIPQLNNLFTLIGWQSYNQVLKNGKPQDLTPGKFATIVKNMLTETP